MGISAKDGFMAEKHGHSTHGGHKTNAGHGDVHGKNKGGHEGQGSGYAGKSVHSSSVGNKKQSIFAALLVGIILLAVAFFFNFEQLTSNLLMLIALLVILFVLWKSEFILFLTDYERAVIFRFGQVNRVGGPGWALMIPVVEDYKNVDLRTQFIDPSVQEVVTKDNIELKIDTVAWVKINKDNQSVINSIIEIEDWKSSIAVYVQSLIRNSIGSMTMNEVISNTDEINGKIREELQHVSKNWGITVENVEIKDVQIPDQVIEAMHAQKAAEQEKMERMEKAYAHKAEIDAVREAAGQLSDKALSYYYIRALEKMSEGKATKIVFPMEISKLAAALSGKLDRVSQAKPEEISPELIQQYAPLLAKFLKDEKKKREKDEE